MCRFHLVDFHSQNAVPAEQLCLSLSLKRKSRTKAGPSSSRFTWRKLLKKFFPIALLG